VVYFEEVEIVGEREGQDRKVMRGKGRRRR
jgi:hypothetical protein